MLDIALTAYSDGVAVVGIPYRRDGGFGTVSILVDGQTIASTVPAYAGREAILAADGVVVAKHASRSTPPARIGLLASVRERRFGESALTFYRWSDGEAG